MTGRGNTYKLSYDAENRPVSVSGPSLSASFVYDGDGNRVQSTVGSTTTTFVGNYYEVSGSTVTKYYYAGSSRVAMNVGGTVTHLLSDQLGSSSITANGSGGFISEIRYTAWGQQRFANGTTPTSYTYTGQYSNMTDFGLMFYNARWYDPALGRFIQADTVVPGGVQGYDRHAYVNNDPTNLTDPSGHFGKCSAKMSGYLCKVQQKKAQELELKWALEAAQKKAAAIAAQMAQQAQMEAYADAMLGQTSFNSPTQILGAGKPLFNIAPPADPYRLQRMVLLGAGAFLAISGLAITAVGLLAVGVLVLEAIGVTTELTPLGLVLDLPHLGMGMVFAGVGTLLGLGVTALGVDMIYQAVRPEPPFSTLFPWQHSSEEP